MVFDGFLGGWFLGLVLEVFFFLIPRDPNTFQEGRNWGPVSRSLAVASQKAVGSLESTNQTQWEASTHLPHFAHKECRNPILTPWILHLQGAEQSYLKQEIKQNKHFFFEQKQKHNETHTCMIEARLYGNCRSCWVRKAGWKHTVWKENNEGKVMDIPAAHNDAQGLSVMRSAPKLRPRTPMSGLVLPSCAQRRPWPAQAGTGTCVHIPIQLIPIASLAWLGKQQPCPLLFFNFLLGTEVDTHTWPPRQS